jgi:hypothetical protein
MSRHPQLGMTEGAIAVSRAQLHTYSFLVKTRRLTEATAFMSQAIPQNVMDGDTTTAPIPPLDAPTKAQVLYWSELCDILRQHKAQGVHDAEWPADLTPSRKTLREMAARKLIVRRSGAWHLKRHWGYTLAGLRLIAVPTPRLVGAARPASGLPTYAELEAWETICRWLDVQPDRRSHLPFGDLDVSGLRLAGMRKQKLVRHAMDCTWVLSPTWRQRLQALWRGVLYVEGERSQPQEVTGAPFSVAFGLDTWYLNRVDPEGLPIPLQERLEALQAQARDQDDEVETPWIFDGAPLRMYRTGVNARNGGGVSWSYILRNGSLALLMRRKPLGGIVAQVRFGSECLWRLTPRRAYEEVDHLINHLWGMQRGTWQVSQAHLAHDVANVTLDVEQLSRYISRSRTDALYEKAKKEIEALSPDQADMGAFGVDWNAIYGTSYDPFFDPLAAIGIPMQDEDEPAEERAVSLYRWGRRLSGVTWSPGAAVSFVQYDKVLEMRRTGHKHMEDIWRAQGWQGEPVTRHEGRLRRDAMRELRIEGVEQDILSDPLLFLEHIHDVWGWLVGQREECPDAIEVAWIRRVIPDEQDSNRSRWPTDPVWQVVQSPSRDGVPTLARKLIRRHQRQKDVERRDHALYGLLVSRVALQHPQGETWDVSRAIGEVVPAMHQEAAKLGKDFGELVRERRRKMGLPLKPRDPLLPAVPAQEIEQPEPVLLDQEPQSEADRRHQRQAQAWRRLEEALLALDRAQNSGASAKELSQLEQVYQQEARAFAALHAAN